MKNPKSTKNRGLGRGLDELFQKTDHASPVERVVLNGGPEDTAEPATPMPENARLAELPIADIVPNPRQPRTEFDTDDLAELAESIREVGVLQPVVVRPLADNRFELVMGERRLRATKDAGLDHIPAIIRETEEHDLLRDALLENLHRAQLNALEEAAAYQQLMDDFGCTQDELSQRIKRSRPQISNTLRLLRLPPTVQRRVAAGVLSAGHARALLALTEAGAQERLAQRIVAEGLSVRTTEEIVAVDPGSGRTARATRRRAAASPRAEQLSEDLSNRFDTRVEVKIGAHYRGRVSIEFSGEEDLARILDLLG